jgi:hypothetical protein
MKADDPVETAVLELGDDPFTDDLDAELEARRPRRVVTRWTVGLAGVAVAVACFAAGAQVQKSYGSPASTAPAGAQQAPGGQGAYGFPGGQAGQGGQRGQRGGQDAGTAPSATAGTAVTGTVKLVDGTTVYVELPDGTVITVRTNGSTTVQTAQPGSLADLSVGATVTVDGARAGETVTATKVTKAK